MDIKEYLLDCYIKTNGEVISKELAQILVEEMSITDGSDRETGEKWTFQECVDVGSRMGIDFNTVPQSEWYLVMNMMYSDYYSVGRKHNMTDYVFYAELSQAWFDDIDAPPNKTFNYFFN